MAAVRLSTFRLITGMTVDVLPDEKAILALRSATAIANRMTGKLMGHVIESVTALAGEVSGTGVVVKAYGHGLPETGMVLIQGTGVSGLDDEKEFVRIDEDRIAILGAFSLTTPVAKGLLFVRKSSLADVVGLIARVAPGPVARIIDIRERSGDRETGPFPEESILDPTTYECDYENQSIVTRIEVYERVGRMMRVPGRIRPVPDRRLRDIQVNYYAGFPNGLPDDLRTAISAFAKAIAEDPTGSMQSENFEDYSYSTATAEIIRQLPTSAISVIMRYRTGR